MMAPDTLERQLTDWLADAATPRDVELADVYAQTRSMTQRHAWRHETLLDGANSDVLPAWSNDGTRIAFIRTEEVGTPRQVSRLMTAAANGADPRAISDRPVDRSVPCWSPDDRSIGVMSHSTKDLLPVVDLVAVDGSGVIEIHEPGGAFSYCAWQRLAP